MSLQSQEGELVTKLDAANITKAPRSEITELTHRAVFMAAQRRCNGQRKAR